MSVALDELAARVARYERTATRRHSAEEIAADRDFQAKADSAWQTLGLGTAPRRAPGETVGEHRAAIADAALTAVVNLDHFRPEWRGFDTASLVKCDDAGATGLASVLLEQAVEAFVAPIGELRESVSKDSSGRETRKFYGDPEGCWGPFKRVNQVVEKWICQGQRGAEAQGGRRGWLFPDGRFVEIKL